jgi:tripartite-type tricarboxylate transporter receptor subunit TctC
MIQLLGMQLARKLGASLNQISYKGVPPVIQDLMGGHIDLSFLPAGGTTATLIDSGKVRVFGTTGARASSRLPHVLPLSRQDPALADFVYGTWAAVFVARALPEATVQRLHQALSNALKDPDLPAYVRSVGSEMAEPMTLEQITHFYQDETRRYRELAREIGLKAE